MCSSQLDPSIHPTDHTRTRDGVHLPKHLVGRHGLGVHPPHHRLLTQGRVGRGQHVNGAGLAGAGRAHHHDAVPDLAGVVQLQALAQPGAVRLQARVADGRAQRSVDAARRHLFRLLPREDVLEQFEEERQICADQFARVHVSQRAHEQLEL